MLFQRILVFSQKRICKLKFHMLPRHRQKLCVQIINYIIFPKICNISMLPTINRKNNVLNCTSFNSKYHRHISDEQFLHGILNMDKQCCKTIWTDKRFVTMRHLYLIVLQTHIYLISTIVNLITIIIVKCSVLHFTLFK